MTADEELVVQAVELADGELRVLQPRDAAELPDRGGVEWAPLVPYWSVLWRSGVALARELADEQLAGRRVVELGCGLALPSLVAARRGAAALATDAEPEAVALAVRNASRNGLAIEAEVVDWRDPGQLLGRGPFDLALAADILYERAAVADLIALLPRLAPRAWVADPGRPAAGALIDAAERRGWAVETRTRGVVSIHRVAFR